jgi:hypothetical protein
MTEAEWLECGSPDEMLTFVHPAASVRKLRLFGVACCRRIWELMPDVKCELAVDIAEGHAEGYCDDEALEAASQRVSSVIDSLALFSGADSNAAAAAEWVSSHDDFARTHVPASAAMANKKTAGSSWARDWDFEQLAEYRQQANVFREIFGNPFRPVALDPAWRTSDVLLLARGIYEEKAFDRMPILADALQDAGCDRADILGHLRDAKQTHVRGCWALDLVLEKE